MYIIVVEQQTRRFVMNERDVGEAMLKRGIFELSGKVNTEMLGAVKYAFGEFFARQLKKVLVIISSSGGDSNVALTICDIFGLYPGEITGLVVDRAYSSAAIILQACDVRLATPNAKILIHNGDCHIDVDDMLDPKSFKEFKRDHLRHERHIRDVLMASTGRTVREIAKECKRDRAMYAEEAVTFGLLNGIHRGPLEWDSDEM
jgi:ATP-dependent Clp protease, protease subunit